MNVKEAAEFIGGPNFAQDVMKVQSEVSAWSANYTAPTDPEYITIRELARRTPGIELEDWIRVINQDPHIQLDADGEVYLFNSRGVELTHKIVTRFAKERWPLLRWIAATIYGYLAAGMSFNLMDKFRKTPSACYDYMVDLAPYALATQATMLPVPTQKVHLARAMYNGLRKVAANSFDWMENSSRNKATKRIVAITPILGVPKGLDSAKEMDRAYDYLETFRGPFLRHLLKSYANKARAALAMYNASFSTPAHDLRAMTQLGNLHPDSNIYFQPFHHVIMVPSHFFAAPFLTMNSKAFSYGALGHAMAREMYRAFDSTMISLSSSGTRSEWLDAASRERLDSKRNCILKRLVCCVIILKLISCLFQSLTERLQN